jgi:hypothetical protein
MANQFGNLTNILKNRMATRTMEGSMGDPKLAGAVPHSIAGAAPKIAMPKMPHPNPAMPNTSNPMAAPLMAPGLPTQGVNMPGAGAPGMMPNLMALLAAKKKQGP